MSTILVVDDETLAREALSKLLEYQGYVVIRAPNGKDAWAMMYDRTPDLVLLDLLMPEMDGVMFLRMVRRSDRWHDLPVVVLTGVADDQKMLQRVRDLNVQDLIPKGSFGFDDLLERVRQHLPHHKA